jgi:hypothetical protein
MMGGSGMVGVGPSTAKKIMGFMNLTITVYNAKKKRG